MKKTLLLLLSSFLFAQEQNFDDIIIFNKGIALYDLIYSDLMIGENDSITEEDKIHNELKEEILDVSINYFEELITNHPDSKLLNRAKYNIAFISHELDYLNTAKKYYKDLLETETNEDEKGGPGEGIMAEPYTLYKNRVAKALAEIYIEYEQFDSAKIYLDLTEKYPYKHFGGNEIFADEMFVDLLYSKIYWGLKEKQKAIDHSIGYVMNDGLADNTNTVNFISKIIKESYDTNEISEELKKALDKIKVIRKKDFSYAEIKIFNNSIKIPEKDSWRIFYDKDGFEMSHDAKLKEEKFNTLSLKEQLKVIFTESLFYKSLTK